jgi:hypothetical protein
MKRVNDESNGNLTGKHWKADRMAVENEPRTTK